MIKSALFITPFPQSAKVIMEASQLPPIGLAYTASYLESKGIKCWILDANLLQMEQNQVLTNILDLDPDLVGISFNVATVKEAISLAFESKRMGKKVIMGGPSSKGELQSILEKSNADCIVCGEGEIVTWNLIQSEFDLSNVKGIAYLDNGKAVHTPEEEKIKDLDSLPFPAYHLLPKLKKYRNRSRRHPIAPMVTSRGCPYGCSFCGSANSGWRSRSPENVVAEIEYLITNFGVRQVDILDDNFSLNIQRAEKICDMIIDKKLSILITFPNGLRADRLTEQLVEKMAKAGVYRTGIGIESGDQGIVDNINKSLKLEKAKLAFEWLRKNKIVTFGYFQFGLPGETKESMQKTLEFALEANPNWANFGVTTPLPGTPLHNELKEKGKLGFAEDEGIDSGFYSVKTGHYDTGDVTMEDIMKFQKMAWKKFYFRPGKILDLLNTMRSYRELEWTVSLTLPILKGVVFKKETA